MKKFSERIIYYLGSSITRGDGGDTDGISFADLFAQKYGAKYQKEAVSGTNLAKVKGRNDSYVERLEKLDFTKRPDVLVVQLSTNDFTNQVSTMQITNALEEIFYRATCEKIVVYSCPLAKDWHSYAAYHTYIEETLKPLLRKYEGKVSLLDLFHSDFALREGYLQADGLHPTRKGYECGFLPQMEAHFEKIL